MYICKAPCEAVLTWVISSAAIVKPAEVAHTAENIAHFIRNKPQAVQSTCEETNNEGKAGCTSA